MKYFIEDMFLTIGFLFFYTLWLCILVIAEGKYVVKNITTYL